MNGLFLLVFIITLCQGFPLHSEKSKSSSKNSAAAKSQGRQYVSQTQQPAQGMVGNQQAYGQYPSGYDTVQTQYGQQNDQQPQQITGQQMTDQQMTGQQMTGQQMTGQQMASKPAINKGHAGILYSHRPVPDHDKDISPPDEKKDKKHKKHKKKFSKSKKHDDDEEK